MVWETSLACLTTGSFLDIECILGNGFGGLFGSPIIATMFLIIFGLILSFKLKLQPELIAVFMAALISVGIMAIAPDWIRWAVLIVFAIITGFGIYKTIKRGG